MANGLPSRVRAAIAICLTLPVLAACDGPGGGRTAMRADSAGVTIVTNADLSSGEDRRYVADIVGRIGAVDGPAEYTFGEVGSVAWLDNQRIAVFDRLSADIRVFSPTGSFERRFGRAGQGPGEFTGDGVVGMIPLDAGSIAVPDIVNQVLTIFDAAGSVILSRRLTTDEADYTEWRGVGGDTVIVRSVARTEETWIRRSIGGGWQDTMAVRPRAMAPPSAADPRMPLPPDRWVWAPDDDGQLLLARMTEPQVTIVAGRQPRMVVRWVDGAVGWSDAEKEALYGVVTRRMGGDPDAGVSNRVREMAAIGDAKHVLAAVRRGPGRSVLVQKLRPATAMDRRVLSVFRSEGYGGREWLVFDATGEYLGTLDFGANGELHQIRGDSILGVSENDLGVQEVFVAHYPPELLRRARAGASR